MKTIAAPLLISAVAVVVHAQRVDIRWEPTGGPIVGTVRQIIVQQRRVLLLSDGGEHSFWWRSRDGGETWDKPSAPGPRPWIVGASDRFIFGDTRDGVVRSSDMGDSWTRCGALPVNRTIGNEVTSIAAFGSRVYVSVLRIGVFRSDDECDTWTQLSTPLRADIPGRVAYVDERLLIVGNGAGLFLSTNEGGDWSRVDERAQGYTFGRACGDVLFAGTGRGLLESRDHGRSWTPLGLPARPVVAVASPRCNEFFAAVQDADRWTNSVFRSTDGGVSWTPATIGLSRHPIYRLSVGEGGAVYAIGAASGAFRWSQGEWRQIGLADAYASSVVTTPRGDLLTATGTGLFRAEAGIASWRQLLVGHEAHISMHMLPTNAYAVTVTEQGDLLAYSSGNGALRSRDRGETWRRVGLTHFVNSFLNTASGAILAGTENGIFRSNDGGETWVERSIGLTAFRTMSFAAAPDGTVYASTSDGAVYRSSDDGERWRPLPAARGTGSPTALVVLRNGHVLAARHSGSYGVSRWDPTTRGWQPVLLNAERGAVVRAVIQDGRGTVFAATDGQGMFASFDEGTTWQPANQGLLTNRIFSLAVDAHGNTVAGTSAGVFRTSTGNSVRREP
jgi:photosystem II stability/assembly factor-like uncharacterized protein